MKKICGVLVLLAIVISVAYIALMTRFEEPICIDLTNAAQVSVENQTITLPWYLEICTTLDCSFSCTDAAGNHYTKFIYAMPTAFESAELNCIVCWETESVTAFLGDSRAMFVIDTAFPALQWH